MFDAHKSKKIQDPKAQKKRAEQKSIEKSLHLNIKLESTFDPNRKLLRWVCKSRRKNENIHFQFVCTALQLPRYANVIVCTVQYYLVHSCATHTRAPRRNAMASCSMYV